MSKFPTLQKDPYVLAYRYAEYMKEYPPRSRQGLNQYYQKLLANQPDPDKDATDSHSRAIRYAKEHHECFYELRDVSRIVGWLDAAGRK